MRFPHTDDPTVSRTLAGRSGRFPPPELVLPVGTPVAFGHRSRAVLRYLDVGLVLIALAPAVAFGVPVLGYVVGAGGWILQRLLAEVDKSWTRRVTRPVRQLGINLFEAFGRIWLLAGVIVIAAVAGGRQDGLTAALVIFAAYSVAFAVKVITGPPARRTRP